MKLESRILLSIKRRPGTVILRRELADMGSPSQVSASLKALQDKGIIVRIGSGVFAKRILNATTGTFSLADSPEAIATEVFCKLGIDMRIASDKTDLTLDPGRRRIKRQLSIDGKSILYAGKKRPPRFGTMRKMPKEGIRHFVEDLAREHHIAYTRTAGDAWAETVTRLSGDDVQSDETGNLLVALKRAKKLSDREMTELLINHLRETRVVRSL